MRLCEECSGTARVCLHDTPFTVALILRLDEHDAAVRKSGLRFASLGVVGVLCMSSAACFAFHCGWDLLQWHIYNQSSQSAHIEILDAGRC
jgi:hypothetical protein